MTPFLSLPVAAQNFACFWALLTCLGGIAAEVQLWRQKRFRPLALSALCSSAAYFILHVCREGTELRRGKAVTRVALALLEGPWAAFLLALALLGCCCVLLYRQARVWRETHVTAASVKESMDGLPAGVCYYLEDGRCILVNHRMQDVCFSLLGLPLQNGASFYEAVREKSVHALSDGTAVTFRHRVLAFEDAPLHELIADDITELYEKNERLRADNERARQLGASMKAYGETISDTVRRQEILQAKINIHDEMNRMILTTRKAAQDGAAEAERRDILRMWQGQALLLCKEADARRSSHAVSDLNALAAVLGMELEWSGVPESEDAAVLSLFLSAAREAMANAAKHAGATRLRIETREDGETLRAAFTNDGRKPEGAAEETGGLRNLRARLEKAGGGMRVETEPVFRLSVTIPKGGKAYGVSGFDRGGSGDAPAAL